MESRLGRCCLQAWGWSCWHLHKGRRTGRSCSPRRHGAELEPTSQPLSPRPPTEPRSRPARRIALPSTSSASPPRDVHRQALEWSSRLAAIWNGPTISGNGCVHGGRCRRFRLRVRHQGDGGGDAVLLKFDPNGNLLWERAWGGSESDSAGAVVTPATARSTSRAGRQAPVRAPPGCSSEVRRWAILSGNGSGTMARASRRWPSRRMQCLRSHSAAVRQQFFAVDVMVLKLTPAGNLVWARTYGAGESGRARRNPPPQMDPYPRLAPSVGEGRHRRHSRARPEDRDRWQLLLGKDAPPRAATPVTDRGGHDGSVFSPERRPRRRRLPGGVRRAPTVDGKR